MVNQENTLENLFQQKIFDLDEDDVDILLKGFAEAEITENLVKRLQLAASSANEFEDVPWKLGRIMGEYRKIAFDSVLLSKFDAFSSEMKLACLSFICGYWDESAPNLQCLKSFLQTVSASIIENAWSPKLKELAVEAVAVAYGNNQSIFMNNVSLSAQLDLIKVYALKNISDSPGKALLARI